MRSVPGMSHRRGGAAVVIVILAVVLTVAATGWPSAATPSPTGAAGCPVTKPNASTPPDERPSPLFHGENGLWVPLEIDGTLEVPNVVYPDRVGLRADGSVTSKYPWWGSRRAGRILTITGVQIGGSGRRLRAQVRRSRWRSPRLWPGYVSYPAPGCWRVTGRAGHGKLTFVVDVQLVDPL